MIEETKAYVESELHNQDVAPVPIRLEGIGTRIGVVAERLGTRKNAATAANSSVDSLQRWIREENMPAFDAAARLCLATGVRMEWLATGVEPMLAKQEYSGVREPDPPPYRAAAPEPGGTEDRDQALLTSALRIVDDVLHKYGYRPYVKPEEFAELVRIVLADLKRGAAEDAAATALNRVLNIARTPRQP